MGLSSPVPHSGQSGKPVRMGTAGELKTNKAGTVESSQCCEIKPETSSMQHFYT